MKALEQAGHACLCFAAEVWQALDALCVRLLSLPPSQAVSFALQLLDMCWP